MVSGISMGALHYIQKRESYEQKHQHLRKPLIEIAWVHRPGLAEMSVF